MLSLHDPTLSILPPFPVLLLNFLYYLHVTYEVSREAGIPKAKQCGSFRDEGREASLEEDAF